MNDSGSGERKLEREEKAERTDSARAEYERRHRERRARVLARHPWIGWLLLALAGAQADEQSLGREAEAKKPPRSDRGESS